MNERHLDDDAFAELSLGETPDAKAAAHLESCAVCREELERFRASVGIFSLASLAWSEARSEALPVMQAGSEKEETRARGNRTPRLVTALSFAVALVLLAIGLVGPIQRMHSTRVHDEDTASVADDDPAGLNSPEQIAKDNQLMADVNYELTHSRAVLLSQYDRQRGVRGGVGMMETGKGSR